MRPVVVISSRTGRYGSALLCVLLLLAFGWEALAGGPRAAIRALPWLGLLGMTGWLLWGSARIVLDEHLLRLDNPLSVVSLPWQSVESAQARWGLEVLAGGQRWKAWAAPARGGLAVGFGPRQQSDVDVPSHLLREARTIHLDLDARRAALLVGEQASLRASDDASRRPGARLRRGRLLLLAALVAGCLLTLA